MAIEIKITYCLFMMTCFDRQEESSSTFNCPAGATCWTAPSEVISSSNNPGGFSLLCPNDCSTLLYESAFSLRSIHLNSIIIQKSTISSQSPVSTPQIKLSPLSVVLDDSSLVENTANQRNKRSSFFHLFRSDRLRYLTFLKVVPFRIDWTAALSSFTRLDSLYIEHCQLPTLDSTFASLVLPALQTLVIRSSSLEYIDREAFSGGLASTLQRLVLAENQLKNVLSLSVYTFRAVWHLDLSKNQLTFVPEIANFPVLRELNLADNRLKYYSSHEIQLQFRLQQFRLEGDKRNTIFYTDEAKTVYQSTKNARSNLPAFYLDSLQRPRFKLPVGGLFMWGQLTDRSPTYNYRPDSLFLKPDGNLVVDKATAVGSTVRTIIGADLSSSFSFDEVTSIEQYRHFRALLVNHIQQSVPVENAFRLRLFGSRMIDHFSGKKKIPSDQIKLMGDLLEEVLDEAAAQFTYVVLIFFRSVDIPWTAADESVFPFSTLSDRYDDIRLPLLNRRIAQHSALIGFELMDGFMGEHPWKPVEQTPTLTSCQTNYVGVSREMIVVGKLYYYLKSFYPTNVLYGLSMDAGCKACFDLATMIRCREEHYPVPDVSNMDVDFVTFTSKNIQTEGNEKLGFRFISNQQRNLLNGRDLSAEVQARAIFYLVSPSSADDLVKREEILQYSSGYFARRS